MSQRIELNGLKKAGLFIVGLVWLSTLIGGILTFTLNSPAPLLVALGIGIFGLLASCILAVADICGR